MTGLVCGYIGSPPSGRRGSGGCCGQQSGAVVVPTGSGLMTAPPAGPAEAEGEAGAGDPPGGVLPGQAFDAGALGDGELDRGDAGRAGLPAAERGRARRRLGRPSCVALIWAFPSACSYNEVILWVTSIRGGAFTQRNHKIRGRADFDDRQRARTTARSGK